MKKIAVLLSIVGIGLAFTASSIQAAPIKTMEKFTKAFCQAQIKAPQENVFIISSYLFSDETKTFTCPKVGDFKMYRSETKDDPGHWVLSVDAVKNSKNVYDCDSKADMGMKTIGLNCYPVTQEVAQHRKPE